MPRWTNHLEGAKASALRGAYVSIWKAKHKIGTSVIVASRSVVFTAMVSLIILGLGSIYAIETIRYRLPALQYTMARWEGVGLFDRVGCFLGVIPGAREGTRDFSDGRALPADEKTLLVASVPQGYWDVSMALEHRSIGGWRTLPLLGIDFLSTAKAVFDTATGSTRGGSTLPQLVAGALLKTNHGSDQGWFRRKLTEILNGAALYATYPLTDSSFQRLVANYLPLAQSTQSGRAGTLYGVELAGLVLFGKHADQLSLAEQALLAASIKMPMAFAPIDDVAGSRLAAARFERIQRRAVYGLRIAYGNQSPSTLQAIAEIDAMRLPQPKLCAGFAPYAPVDAARRFQVTFNPVLRAQYFAAPEITQAIAELRTLAGNDFNTKVGSISLSLNEADNLAFKSAVRERLSALQADKAASFPIAFLPGTAERLGDVLFAATDAEGRIRLFYQSAERPLFDVPRATGSVAKTLAAILLARDGNPNRSYCNLRIDGVLHNADGNTGSSSCGAPGAMVSARQSFGKSLSLPIAYTLRKESRKRIEALTTATQFSPFKDTPLSTAIAFGMVNAAPSSMLRVMSAVRGGVSGRDPSAQTPRLIQSVAWRYAANKQSESNRLDLSAYLNTAKARDFAGSVLAAPLAPGGTAASLKECAGPVQWDLAKTGTVAQAGRVSGKLLLASGRLQREPISVVGVIADVEPSGDIGVVTTKDVAHIICEGMSRLEVQS